MRALIALAVLLVLSSAYAAPVAIISAAAKFQDLTAIEGGGSYEYLYYVTNSTWQPSQFRWDCHQNPDVCTHDCGEEDADGPQCENPTVPYNAPYGLDLETWPWQVRWGIPRGVGINNGVGIPSGFGFRGTYNQGITNIYDIFWVGEAVHFNNVIIASNNEADSWTLVLTLYVTVNGVTTSGVFRYRLRLDETLNRCSEDDGCPWTSEWWEDHPLLDTRPNCPALTDEPRIDGDGLRCCRYYTIKDFPCADRVWTLDALDQTQSMTVNGRPYTLNIKGFSNPNNISQQKDYFISQERGKTVAEIYAQLVDACPAVQSCPAGQNLTVVGTQCVCTCPTNLPACPSPQTRNSTCGCSCPSNAINCNGGTVVTSGNTCACECGSVTCSGGVKVPDSSNRCQCICPANICNGGTPNPSVPNCPCTCPACPTGQVSDARCNCACPAGAAAACTATPGATYDSTTCVCTGGCACTNNTCQVQSGCVSNVCSYNYFPGVACDPDNNLCVAKCGANGQCEYSAVDCYSQTPTLDTLYGANAQCYARNCVPGTGECVESFLDGQSCDLDLSGTGDKECQKAECRDVAGVRACIAVPDATKDGEACTLSSNDQCNAAACSVGRCVNNPQVNQPCDDGNACTFLDNFVDPVTGKNSDGCVTSETDPNIAVCKANRTVCDHISIPCNNITCITTPTGAFCLMTPLEYGRACDDGTECTVNDICQRELRADPVTGIIDWVDSGVCSGTSAECATDNPCLVGRCLEGGGCNYRADVRQDFICGASDDNCTVFRCDNGTCVEAESICPGAGSRTGAIVGATVAGVAAIAAAAAIAAYARNRIANSKVFDPTTWDQLQAGAGTNSPLYAPKTNEQLNQLYHSDS